jgi:predicted NUDIX family NTP pyrophosphohydrolase
MGKTSAGILPYRRRDGVWEVLLVHPGGPFWAKKDLGAWSIAKGEYEADEEPFQAALREFEEETGFRPGGSFVRLRARAQPSGKVIEAWAVEADWDPSALRSNTFPLEWPKGSGRVREVPEVDRAAWFSFPEAARRVRPAQQGFLQELQERLAAQERSGRVV